MRKGIVGVFLSIAVAAGCGSPRLIDQKPTQSDAEYLEQVFSSSVVVVGVIVSDTLVRLVPSHWDSTQRLQFRKLTVDVENILRGGSVPKTCTVYYFAWVGGYDGPRLLGFYGFQGVGSRHVMWLRRDSGVLRTACDVRDECTMPVGSGAHPNYRVDPKMPLGHALADIWFAKGQGVSDEEFARQIDRGAPSTVSEEYLIAKLQALAATGPPVVRTAACTQLSYYRQICVDRHTKD